MKTLRATMTPLVDIDRRSSTRWRVELIVSAGPQHDMSEALVRNLSDKGLMLQTDAPLDVGETIMVELPDTEPTAARVMWGEGSSYGCEFLEPISSAAISAALLQAPLTGPEFATHKPNLEEFAIGRCPSVSELADWKAHFERTRGAEGYRIIAFRQGAGGLLVAVAARQEDASPH